MAETISTLVLKVDLSCVKCYNKIRKVLCRYDCQIHNKTFDAQNNMVTVTGCFNPCQFSRKLCCKAGKGVIISIHIQQNEVKEPEPPPPPPEVITSEKPDEAVQEDKPEEKPAAAPTPQPPEPTPAPPPAQDQPAPAPKIVVPYVIMGYPRPQLEMPCRCGRCYSGHGGGPCHQGASKMPAVPPPSYYGYDYGQQQPSRCNCGCGGSYKQCMSYVIEENPATCTIM